jgi:hypothetical protein
MVNFPELKTARLLSEEEMSEINGGAVPCSSGCKDGCYSGCLSSCKPGSKESRVVD